MGRKLQAMDRPGVCQVPEGSGEQGKMEKTGCKIICGAPTTLAVKGLMMMMMMIDHRAESACQRSRSARGHKQKTEYEIGYCLVGSEMCIRDSFFPLSLCLARWFWPDLINGRHVHTTAVWVYLRCSGGLRAVRLPAGSWHGLTRW